MSDWKERRDRALKRGSDRPGEAAQDLGPALVLAARAAAFAELAASLRDVTASAGPQLPAASTVFAGRR